MSPPLQYGVTVKREEHGEHDVHVKQEEHPEKSAPTLAPKAEPANHATIVPQEANRKNRNKKAPKLARSDPAGGFLTKKQRRALYVSNLEKELARLRQQLLRKVPLEKIGTNKKKADTSTSLKMEIFQLKKQLKDAQRDGENARRDLRAYKNSIAREKEQFEAALNEKFEEMKADNGMQAGKLENKLEQEKAKTDEAHRLLRESVKLVAHMTSLLKGQGGSVH
ncbi:unnamed protein product [Alternaria alternata]